MRRPIRKYIKFFVQKNWEGITNLVVLASIFLFLFSYFKPEYLLLKTVVAGGDTASQYYPAYFLKQHLLPKLKIIGWNHGWYAGFPIFQFYFPLLFVASATMAYLIPLQISFKIVTVLGTFLLPLTAFYCMKIMKFKFPIPIIAAIFTLSFLFNEGNSMWGGNIPSTLAGEFSFSFSLSLMVLLAGLLYVGVEERKWVLRNSVTFALMTISHIITVVVFCLASCFFLLSRKKFLTNFKYLFLVYFFGSILIAFWLLPLVFKLEYTTPFFVRWYFSDARREILPDVLVPFYLLSFFGLYTALKTKDKRVLYFLFFAIVSIPLYFLSHLFGIVDIRFLPFVQLFPLLVAAYGLGELIGKKLTWIFPVIVFVVTAAWVQHNTRYIKSWIEWNYSGFESKGLWQAFSAVNNFLRGNEGDPRVVYEHSSLHDDAGSVRAFESLPLFSGRSTLEGLYMQSTITSPFVFYIQSEISEVASCPFLEWSPCATFNSTRAAKHLKMFNVKHVITRTDRIKTELSRNPLYKLVAKFEPFEVFELTINKDKYVEVPSYNPVVFKTNNWKRTSYEWFKREDLIDVPLVFTEDKKGFRLFAESLEEIPKVPIENNCTIQESVQTEEIKFKTNCIGKPHIIKISYFPNWKVEGASKIYLVSPSFMLVIPEREDIRIYYGKLFVDVFGEMLTYIGIGIILFRILLRRKVRSFIPWSTI